MSKIRTIGQLQDSLDNGFSWRIKEISNLKVVVKGNGALAQSTVIRAGVPLVYAHWEGFIKESTQNYLRFVTGQRLRYEQLASCFVVFGAKKHLAAVTSSRKSSLNIEAIDFFRNRLIERAEIPLANAIDTKSNLSSEVFENIASSIGVKTSNYTAYYNLIDESLLNRRNGIAHGEYMDLTPDDFRSLADNIIGLIRMFKTDIENLASTSSYRID